MGSPTLDRRLRRATTLLPALACVLGLAAGPAHASGTAVLKDCAFDGVLSSVYTAKDYADALAHMPTDNDEYLDCRDEIRRAQLVLAAKAGRRSSGPGDGTPAGGGATPPASAPAAAAPAVPAGPGAPASEAALAAATTHDRAAVERARRTPPPAPSSVTLRGGASGFRPPTRLSTLPSPLVVVLGGLVLTGALALPWSAARLMRRRRTVS
jgi:hypothetical protein